MSARITPTAMGPNSFPRPYLHTPQALRSKVVLFAKPPSQSGSDAEQFKNWQDVDGLTEPLVEGLDQVRVQLPPWNQMKFDPIAAM